MLYHSRCFSQIVQLVPFSLFLSYLLVFSLTSSIDFAYFSHLQHQFYSSTHFSLSLSSMFWIGDFNFELIELLQSQNHHHVLVVLHHLRRTPSCLCIYQQSVPTFDSDNIESRSYWTSFFHPYCHLHASWCLFLLWLWYETLLGPSPEFFKLLFYHFPFPFLFLPPLWEFLLFVSACNASS